MVQTSALGLGQGWGCWSSSRDPLGIVARPSQSRAHTDKKNGVVGIWASSVHLWESGLKKLYSIPGDFQMLREAWRSGKGQECVAFPQLLCPVLPFVLCIMGGRK